MPGIAAAWRHWQRKVGRWNLLKHRCCAHKRGRENVSTVVGRNERKKNAGDTCRLDQILGSFFFVFEIWALASIAVVNGQTHNIVCVVES
jgi:hypothetical protein